MSAAIETKPSNPKDAIGSDKLPIHLWPSTATAMGCLGLLDGMLKYGRSNFRAIGIRMSIYVDAAKRHIDALFEGEDVDPDSGLPHLAHALACLAIIADADAAGKLTDDRQYPGGYRDLVTKLTPHVARLKQLRRHADPKHYTIADQRPTRVHRVVAAVIVREGRVFLQRRARDDESFGGMWECPGGGIEAGEDLADAITRELKEEIRVFASGILMAPIWSGAVEGYGSKRLEFSFLHVGIPPRAKPKSFDGQAGMAWVKPSEARALQMTPGNTLAWPTIEQFVANGCVR